MKTGLLIISLALCSCVVKTKAGYQRDMELQRHVGRLEAAVELLVRPGQAVKK